MAESLAQKAQANKLFALADYSQAVSEYDKALASCPNYLDFEIAVLRSNIAACHLKLRDWQAAIDAATAALDSLDRLLPPPPAPNPGEEEEDHTRNQKKGKTPAGRHEDDQDGQHAAVVEIDADDAAAEEAELDALARRDQRRQEIGKIRAKALLRRAKAKEARGGADGGSWADLQGAADDYRACAALATDSGSGSGRDRNSVAILPLSDLRAIQTALQHLAPQITAAKDRETAEMMAKLKQLGNGILKPFGLSTDNFKMVKDEKTGGYSMNFSQGS